MKIVVDRDLCEANGVCVRDAPTAFHLDEKDQLYVITETVSVEQRVQVEQAVRHCPKQALTLQP